MATSNQITLKEPGETVIDRFVECSDIPDRGRGLVATKDFNHLEQVFFIPKPRTISVDTGLQSHYCSQCLRTDGFVELELTHYEGQGEFLKYCARCREVKYCSRACQTLAWRIHKHECKALRRWHESRTNLVQLSPVARTLVRLLAMHRHGLISEAEWSSIHLLKHGNVGPIPPSHAHATLTTPQSITKRLQDIVQSTLYALELPSAEAESVFELVKILQACCHRLFVSTDASIGLVFHPLLALLNHDCKPNAFLRFDVSPDYTPSTSPNPVHGAISVHALRPIKTGEEVTISYFPSRSQSTSQRQLFLQTMYGFTCTCSECEQPNPSLPGDNEYMAALSFATNVLVVTYNGLQKTAASELEKAMFAGPLTRSQIISIALTSLLKKGHPIDKAPAVELRIEYIRCLSMSTMLANLPLLGTDVIGLYETILVQLNLLYYRVFVDENDSRCVAGRLWCLQAMFHNSMKLFLRNESAILTGNSNLLKHREAFLGLLHYALWKLAALFLTPAQRDLKSTYYDPDNGREIGSSDDPPIMQGLLEMRMIDLLHKCCDISQWKTAWFKMTTDEDHRKAHLVSLSKMTDRALEDERRGEWLSAWDRRYDPVLGSGVAYPRAAANETELPSSRDEIRHVDEAFTRYCKGRKHYTIADDGQIQEVAAPTPQE